jgi:hypothetical protein
VLCEFDRFLREVLRETRVVARFGTLSDAFWRVSASSAVPFRFSPPEPTTGRFHVASIHLGDAENFAVDTPNLAFSVLRPGIYKITVNEAGDTTVIEDRVGEGEVTGAGSAYTVHEGESDTFTGTDQLYADRGQIYDNEDEFELVPLSLH